MKRTQLPSATGLAWGRIAFGTALVLSPERAARGWVGADAAAEPATKLLARGMGVRDLGLGIGLVAALDTNDDSVPLWLSLGVVSDTIDALSTLVAWRHLPRWGRGVALTVAGGAAVIGAGALADT